MPPIVFLQVLSIVLLAAITVLVCLYNDAAVCYADAERETTHLRARNKQLADELAGALLELDAAKEMQVSSPAMWQCHSN
jgi:hypothetical protein